MPFIKKIELNGFKTFGRKTTLIFNKGFTAITGPNGSGKTNIIDAVLFALGELSARRLRSQNFSNLIFHGSTNPNVKQKRKAKVVIQFDNSDGRLPTETKTVTVSRDVDQTGQSVYRINGRRVSRSYTLENLSMAGISPYGHNVILQGRLTKMAEISPVERRKIIEDTIGIAQYDGEKTEAENKLKSANIQITTAMGQVGEVQRRIEALERERNNLLRNRFLVKKIKILEAHKLSQDISETQNKLNTIATNIRSLEEQLEYKRDKREKLRSERRYFESEWHRLGFQEYEEKQKEVFNTQIRIGELRAKLAELDMKLKVAGNSQERFLEIQGNAGEQYENAKKSIADIQERVYELESKQKDLSKTIHGKESEYNRIHIKLVQKRTNLEDKNNKIKQNENILDQIYQELLTLKGEQAKNDSKLEIFSARIRDLTDKENIYKTSLSSLEELLNGLNQIQKEQKTKINLLDNSLEKQRKRKKKLQIEIKEASKLVKIARESFVEFEARRELIEKVQTEERSIQHIEELSDLGVIEGIHGRMRNVIQVKKKYENAIEAAAAGWLDSLIVEDMDIGFACVEALKKLKLGRIKIVPLKGLSTKKGNGVLESGGIKGRVLDQIKYDEVYEEAINYVFGDTIIASDYKDALNASHNGFRSVTLQGDLYETGGGVESGFYRKPLNFSSFIPSKSTLKVLDKAVNALEDTLKHREIDILEIEKALPATQDEIRKIAESSGKLRNEINRVNKNVLLTKNSIELITKKIIDIKSIIREEKSLNKSHLKRKIEISNKKKSFKENLLKLKEDSRLPAIQELIKKRDELGNDIILLNKKSGKIDSDLQTLRAEIEKVLKVYRDNAKKQYESASAQILRVKGEVEGINKDKETLMVEIDELIRIKDTISDTLLNNKEEGVKLSQRIKEIDTELQKLEEEYDKDDAILDDLKLNFKTLQIQISGYIEKISDLGYERGIEKRVEGIEDITSSLKAMRKELERVGAVNQLADDQYRDQISRYRELSIRMNELEKEKISILDFIDEIEHKKYNAFMEAFNKINERIDRYFSKVTGGGNAALKLENIDNPFSGGVDMVVQFLGKPPILVSGASSGERSISAVAFLFSLQEFTPASFYLLDEVDAHLDAFHVDKLGELLAEEAERSQFVVVTLKPEMVSKANRIYGVYGRDGVSHIVSTTFQGNVK